MALIATVLALLIPATGDQSYETAGVPTASPQLVGFSGERAVHTARTNWFASGNGSAIRRKRTDCNKQSLVNAYSASYYAVAKSHGRRAPGRNIRRWGLTEKTKSQCRHLRRSLNTLRRMRFPGNRMLVAGKPYTPPAQTRTLNAPAGGTLARIAQCESGGNPRAVNPNGHYGKYQFDQQTWESVGGGGNPAAASEAEQDKRAAILYSQRGGAPWECKG